MNGAKGHNRAGFWLLNRSTKIAADFRGALSGEPK
jgi:hypothetical protein